MSATDTTPVAYGVQADDGSIGNKIAPVGWATFEAQLNMLKAEPWVVAGKAKIVPLYLNQPERTEP